MNVRRCAQSLGTAAVLAVLSCLAPPRAGFAQNAGPPSLEGGWTLNKNQSDQLSMGRDDQAGRGDGDRQGGRGSRRGGGGGGGFGGRGGIGGRGGGMGRGGNPPAMNPDEMARQRDAMRDVMNPPDHLLIAQTPSMIVLTSRDGRTTRLAPNGTKIKDDNTKVERKTSWEAGRLVSEISGLGPSKMTQTFAVDPESHQLRITVQVEGNGRMQARSFTHVYDLDQK